MHTHEVFSVRFIVFKYKIEYELAMKLIRARARLQITISTQSKK